MGKNPSCDLKNSISHGITVLCSSHGSKNHLYPLNPRWLWLTSPFKKKFQHPLSTQILPRIKKPPVAEHPPRLASLTCGGLVDGRVSSMPAGLFVPGSRGRCSVAFVCWRCWVCNAAPRIALPRGGRMMMMMMADESAAPTRAREGEDGRGGGAEGDPARWTPRTRIY